MPNSTKNALRMLHPEQEDSQKKPFDRQIGEPLRWFWRFRRYVQMGRDRSLQACFEQERQDEQAIESVKNRTRTFPLDEDALQKTPAERERGQHIRTKLTIVKPSLPGNWSNACKKWNWVERAEAWDIEQHQLWQTRLTKDVLLEAEFASRSYRIFTMNLYLDFLQKIITCTDNRDPLVSMRDRMLAMKLSQSLMRDIKKEMSKLENPF